MDTWNTLEACFREIGSRGHNVVLAVGALNNDECYYTLSGPVKEGEYRITLVGRPLDGSEPKADYSTGHYSVIDLDETLRRAGKLMNAQEKRDLPAQVGARRFVGALFRKYKSFANEESGNVFFPNGAQVCGMMAGAMASGFVSNELESICKRLPKGRSESIFRVIYLQRGHTVSICEISNCWGENELPSNGTIVKAIQRVNDGLEKIHSHYTIGGTATAGWSLKEK